MHFVMWVLSVFPKHCLEMITIIVQRKKKNHPIKEKRARKVMANNCAVCCENPQTREHSCCVDVEMKTAAVWM